MVFWIIKLSSNIYTGNISGTVFESWWNNTSVPNCTVNGNWLDVLFADIADSVDLSGANAINGTINIS